MLALPALVGCGPDYDDVANLDSRGSRIICFGDSITHGHGATRGNEYPAILAKLLGRPVVNAGADGDTTRSALKRLERDVLRQDPWIVIIELGGNDFLRKIPKDETERNLSELTRLCAARGAIVVLLHAKFGLFSDPYEEAFEAAAEAHGALLVPNVLKGILGNPKNLSDQIHPNDAGYALLATRVAEALRPLIVVSTSRRGAVVSGS